MDKSFGDLLREELERRTWTAGKFAEQVEVDTKTVYRWLNNRSLPQKFLREKVIQILGFNTYVFEEEGSMGRGRREKPVLMDDTGALTIGAKMRVERQRKGIRLKTMAELTKHSSGYLSSAENGNVAPSLDLVEKYEVTLGLSGGELANLLHKKKQGEQIKGEDWLNVPVIGTFYGREDEIHELKKWIVGDRCQIVAVLGLGGIGKTALVMSVVQQIRKQFEYIIWRSLQNNPSVENILSECIQLLSDHQHSRIPEHVDDQIKVLLQYLNKHRCLIILDNLESVLRENTEYGKVLQSMGAIQHQSCILLTSRQKPGEIALLEAKTMPVRSMLLAALELDDARLIIQEKKLSGTDEHQARLIELYDGNPLALKLVSEFIREIFDGDIALFLEEGKRIFGDIRDLLREQFARLPELEQEIMYWMAIEREEVTLEDLQEDLIKPPRRVLLEAMVALQRRFMIEKKGSKQFTVHPVILEYVTDTLVEHICEELDAHTFRLLKSHALIKAQTKEYIRDRQIHLILKPIITRLHHTLGKRGSTRELKNLLAALREEHDQPLDYMAGNILNLLVQLGIDLRGMDFSHLRVQQAYLQGVALPDVNFAYATFEKSVFTDTFGSILSIALSVDGCYLAAGTASGVIRFWQVADSQPVHICEGHLDWVRWVTFSPDGSLLASGSDDKTIRVWEVESGQCIRILREHEHRVRTAVFSPDGKLLASSSDDKTIRLWDVKSGRCMKILRGHEHRVRTVTFSLDGYVLASGSDDKTIRIWEVESEKCIRILRGHEHWVRTVAFSPDGRLLVSGSDDKTIRIWNIENGQCMKVLQGHTNVVRTLAFCSDGSLLASGSEDQTIRLWEMKSGDCKKTLQDHTNAVRSLAFTADGKMLVSGSDDQTIRYWEIDQGRCLRTLQGYSTWVYTVAFSPDGRLLASGGQDHQVRIWDVRRGECLKTLQGHQGVVYSVAFSPDGRLLASGSQDHQVRVWDVETGECRKVFRGHSNQINSVAFSPDGQLLVSGGEDNIALVWDLRSAQYFKVLQGHTRRVRAVAFSPDGLLIATSSEDTTVRLWSVHSEKEPEILPGHSDQVRSVAFSPDGRLVAAGSEDNTICIWKVHNGKLPQVLREHAHRVRSVTFSPDGRWLVSGSEDKTIRIWSVSSGKCVKTLQGHQGLVYSVAFDAHERMIASGSYDGTIKFWDMDTGGCVKTLRSELPYEKMNIKGVAGLTLNQKNMLKMLGAIER